VKKAVPVRLPDCPEGDLPTTKQVEFYLLLWERQRKPLARDPGPGFSQKSFWLDPEELDADAYDTECFRAGRPDRALFIRRLIATYHKHKGTTSKPMSIATPSAPGLAAQTVSVRSAATMRQMLERASVPSAVRETELSAAQVNEISRSQGLGICWQPGNVYCIGRTANAKSCLVLMDAYGRELGRYGSW
jgi:hypothetical protein